MSNPRLKSKGLGIQLVGVFILAGGTRGFFIFEGDLGFLYFPGLIVAVIAFAVCLFWGGSLVKLSKV
jgi:hypothetical protein